MPSLLAEYVLLPVDIGIKDRVQINVHQVLKIRVIAARNGIDCLVRIGHGIEKCIERPLDELYKRVLDRETSRAAQNSVFDNVRHAGGILRRRAEGDVKDFIVILRGKKGDPCARLFVAHKQAVTACVLQILMPENLIFFQNILTNVHEFLTGPCLMYHICYYNDLFTKR